MNPQNLFSIKDKQGFATQLIIYHVYIFQTKLTLQYNLCLNYFDNNFSLTFHKINNPKTMTDTSIKMDNEQVMINCPDGFDAPLFAWNQQRTSSKLSFLDQEALMCKSNDGNGFKTTLGTQLFTEGGRYYYQIFINKGQLIKIGISRPNITNLESAFCDTMDGWAIYNGQTRHNSNSTGPYYGTQLAAGDIIGVALDTVEGTISFYRNGQSWGVAFKEETLKQGDFVAAVAPIYSGDQFTLRSMIKED